MPDVSSSGTYDKDSTGFSKLNYSFKHRLIKFSGTSIGTQCTIEVMDDQGAWDDVANNTVTSLPTDKTVMIRAPLRLVFTGSPSCNVSIEELDDI